MWRALRLLEAFRSGETAGLAFEEWVAELLDELAGLEEETRGASPAGCRRSTRRLLGEAAAPVVQGGQRMR